MISGNTRLQSPALHTALLLTCIYFVVFLKIGSFPFRLWDESMFAVNAYEMEKSGNYMVPTFEGETDWRNSKPLLLTWIQVGCIRFFGFSEFSMRLPSALAVAGSVLMLFHFLRKRIDLLFAWMASLILLTSTGYITYHTGRTGDADALLSFFLLACCIFYLKWIEAFNFKALFWCFVFFSLALMTKSFAALLILPGMVVFALFHQKYHILRIFRSRYFYLGLLISAIAVFVIFPLREFYQPGFLDYTFSHDAGRMGTVIEKHQHGWDFYLSTIFYDRFTFWGILFLTGILLTFRITKNLSKILAWATLSIWLGYLVIISFSTTKLVWYDMPLYPLMAAISAIPVYFIFQKIQLEASPVKLVLAIIFVFIIPYRKMFFASQNNAFSPGDHKEELADIFLFDQLKSGQASDLTVYHYGYHGSLLCYKYRYADQGYELRITSSSDFKPGETVFVSHDSLKENLISTVQFDTVSAFYDGLIVQIKP